MKSKFIHIFVVLGLLLGHSVSVAYTGRGQYLAQTGWFAVRWGDSVNGDSRETYTLVTDDGQTISLQMPASLIQQSGGIQALDRRYVTVQGITTLASEGEEPDATFTVAAISLREEPAPPIRGGGGGDYPPPPLPVGNVPWITIMCKFPEESTEQNNLAYFQGMYSSAKPGLDHYWREQSYDKVNLVGSNAAGWFVLPHPLSYYNPTLTAGGTNQVLLATDCATAADPSVDFSLYQTGGINMAFNRDFDNGWSWGGTLSIALDGISQQWRNTWIPPWGFYDVSLVEHEMGHGFGMPHSSGTYGLTYDSAWDVMSWDRYNCAASTDPVYHCLGQHAIAAYKDLVGWIDPGKKIVVGVGSSVTINMERLVLPTNGNYLLARIPIGGSSTHSYTVEVRQTVGYDVKLPGTAVIIHEMDVTRSDGRWAFVLDEDGNGQTWDSGAMWTVGESFHDAANDISVSVLSSTPTGFQVQIVNGIPDNTPPTLDLPADITVSQVTPAGALVNFTVTADDAIAPPHPAVTCTPDSGSMFPVGITTVNCSATDAAGNTANGSFKVRALAANQLLLNPGFDAFNLAPKAWVYSAPIQSVASLTDCTIFFISPNCSLKLLGANRSRTLTQTVLHSGSAGDEFTFGLSSAAFQIPAGGAYKVEVSLVSGNFSRPTVQTLNFTPDTHRFESVKGRFSASASYAKIVFRITFNKTSGTAWFDDAFLYLLP